MNLTLQNIGLRQTVLNSSGSALVDMLYSCLICSDGTVDLFDNHEFLEAIDLRYRLDTRRPSVIHVNTSRIYITDRSFIESVYFDGLKRECGRISFVAITATVCFSDSTSERLAFLATDYTEFHPVTEKELCTTFQNDPFPTRQILEAAYSHENKDIRAMVPSLLIQVAREQSVSV